MKPWCSMLLHEALCCSIYPKFTSRRKQGAPKKPTLLYRSKDMFRLGIVGHCHWMCSFNMLQLRNPQTKKEPLKSIKHVKWVSLGELKSWFCRLKSAFPSSGWKHTGLEWWSSRDDCGTLPFSSPDTTNPYTRYPASLANYRSKFSLFRQ